MTKQPALSIIVPIYNAEKYIARCMDSIYAQTFQDFEIILVNDGSTDRSADICREFARNDNRIRFINKENGGAGSARNAGLEIAQGEYVAFPDVDDWFESNMYDELYKVAVSGDYDVVFSGVNYYKQIGDGEVKYDRKEIRDNVSFMTKEDCRKNIMTFFPTTTIFDVPWNKLYKRSIITDNNVHFSDIRRCQDAMFNIDFFNHISSAVMVGKAYYNYMVNTAADVQRKFPQNYIDITITYYTHLIDVLESWNVYSGAIKQHYDTSFAISVFSTACMYDNPKWELTYKEQKEYIRAVLSRQEVQSFLPTSDIREDRKWMFDILKDVDLKKVMRWQRNERIKERIRQNKILISIVRQIRRRK